MKKNHTDITIVLDHSGSMQNIASDTIGGFNRFLDDQKKAAGTASLTLYQFDHVFEELIQSDDVQKAPALSRETFVPRGGTALLDAMGRAINETGRRLAMLPDHERAEKVVMVIITDGQENASTEFKQATVFEMIKHQREKYQWEFVFLGANQDAIKTASAYGIPSNNAMTYANNSAGTVSAFAAASSNLRSMRSGDCVTMGFSDEQRDEQKAAGA